MFIKLEGTGLPGGSNIRRKGPSAIGWVVVVAALALLAVRCGGSPIVEKVPHGTFEVAPKRSIEKPLKITGTEARSITKLAVWSQASAYERTEDVRFYSAVLDSFLEDLRKTGRFELVADEEFAAAGARLRATPDVRGMTEMEVDQTLARIGRDLDVQAVLTISLGHRRTETGPGFLAYEVAGPGDFSFIVVLEILSTRDAAILYQQAQQARFVSRGSNVGAIPLQELKAGLKPVTNRLVDDVTMAFGAAVSQKRPARSGETGPPGARDFMVTVKAANVRAEPSVSSPVIATVKKEAYLERLGSRGNWHQVRLPSGAVGWIRGDLTKTLK